MEAKTKFNEILDKVEKMPLDDQNLVIEILRNRYIEFRREEILKNAQGTLEEYKSGLTSHGKVADLLKDIETDEPDLGK